VRAQGLGVDGETLAAMLSQLRPDALPVLNSLLLRGNPVGDEGVEAVCTHNASVEPARVLSAATARMRNTRGAFCAHARAAGCDRTRSVLR
jgi:hypothetical protein